MRPNDLSFLRGNALRESRDAPQRVKIFTREDQIMTNCTNGGCACTPNQSIKCTVNNCANHCQDNEYCGLNTIQVGTHESNPTMVECTDCQSFKLK